VGDSLGVGVALAVGPGVGVGDAEGVGEGSCARTLKEKINNENNTRTHVDMVIRKFPL
jgi:hypothetical protein